MSHFTFSKKKNFYQVKCCYTCDLITPPIGSGFHGCMYDMVQLDYIEREVDDLVLENRIFKSYFERNASESAADADDDKRKPNRQRRRQLPTALTIEQKVEIGVYEQEVANRDVSGHCTRY